MNQIAIFDQMTSEAVFFGRIFFEYAVLKFIEILARNAYYTTLKYSNKSCKLDVQNESPAVCSSFSRSADPSPSDSRRGEAVSGWTSGFSITPCYFQL